MLNYDDATHVYRLDDKPITSLTQMLDRDGWNVHLGQAPVEVVNAKALWGTRLHTSLLAAEHGLPELIGKEFGLHVTEWMDLCRKMQWVNPLPIWEKAELPMLYQKDGFAFGFTPDRAHPSAVVEIKGTYSPHPSHSIQTALQVLGMGYDRLTPRYIAYFSKDGLKKLHTCAPTFVHQGNTLNAFDEAERIIFEYAEMPQ
jgi:hypothetical protein